jgi:hypothetical protein
MCARSEREREPAEFQRVCVRQQSLGAFIPAPAQEQRLCQAAPDMHASNAMIKNATQAITQTHGRHLSWKATGRASSALAEDAEHFGRALAEDGGRAGVKPSGPTLSLGPAERDKVTGIRRQGPAVGKQDAVFNTHRGVLAW